MLGLTVLELMAVIAALGIIAAFAMPMWRDYLVRARFVEVLAAAVPHRAALEGACRDGQLEGADHARLGLAAPDQVPKGAAAYVSAIEASGAGAASGQIAITLTEELGGGIERGAGLILRGQCGDGRMRWSASGRGVPERYLPEFP